MVKMFNLFSKNLLQKYKFKTLLDCSQPLDFSTQKKVNAASADREHKREARARGERGMGSAFCAGVQFSPILTAFSSIEKTRKIDDCKQS